jgi:hypothetical protein
MPDHVHMIIKILQPVNESGPTQRSAPTNSLANHRGPTQRSAPTNTYPVGAGLRARPANKFIQSPPHLFKIVQWFKSITTNAYFKYLAKINAPADTGKLWQRGYYEHVIRNEIELAKIREYIVNNPFLEHKDDHDLEDYL